jgi:N6-adenosine-specific RNA methylase IME4
MSLTRAKATATAQAPSQVGASTRARWAGMIRSRLGDSVAAIVDVGRLLIDAKAGLPHGEFEAMVEQDLPFHASTAQRLMKVARHALLANPAHVRLLPPAWGTLYELTKLPEALLKRLLSDGSITPETERKDVLRLLQESRDDRGLDTIEDGKTATTDALEKLTAAGRTFGTIYADPPWRYDNQGTRAATDNHYETMTVEEIAALPVEQLAAPNSHLHLWTTNAFLFDCKGLMEAWGFEYKSALIWVKPQMGIGNYWRVSHEFLLLGVRGSCPFRDRSRMSWIEAERTVHSRKPDVFRQAVEAVSPGPRLELFGREVVEGWTVWGNEIPRGLVDSAPASVSDISRGTPRRTRRVPGPPDAR